MKFVCSQRGTPSSSLRKRTLAIMPQFGRAGNLPEIDPLRCGAVWIASTKRLTSFMLPKIVVIRRIREQTETRAQLRLNRGNSDWAQICSTLNLSAVPYAGRFRLMTERKCSSCGKAAFAYRIEADGSKTYLCLEHFPDEKPPAHWDQEKPSQGLQDPAKS